MNVIDSIVKDLKKSKGASAQKKYLLKLKVVELLYKEGRKSISELCGTTNNSIPSLTSVINELFESGWIVNYGMGESKGGRKPSLYGLNNNAGFIVGIDLSRTYTHISIFDMHNESLGNVKELKIGLDTNENILNELQAEITQLLKLKGIDNEQIVGYGIAIPGLIDIKKGISYSYPQLGQKNLNETFSNLFGRPAFVEHDTKSMVLGEAWFGLARNMDNALFIDVSEAIGLGAILNGKPYHGKSGFAGELGHIQMDFDGELCYCGRVGCLETVASGKAIVNKAIDAIQNGKSSVINKLAGDSLDDINFDIIIKAAKQSDQFALELLENLSENLARAISTLLHLFNPEIIIIGGELAKADELILDLIQPKLNKYTLMQLKQDSQLVLSELAGKVRLLGVIPVVMSKVFTRSIN